MNVSRESFNYITPTLRHPLARSTIPRHFRLVPQLIPQGKPNDGRLRAIAIGHEHEATEPVLNIKISVAKPAVACAVSVCVCVCECALCEEGNGDENILPQFTAYHPTITETATPTRL